MFAAYEYMSVICRTWLLGTSVCGGGRGREGGKKESVFVCVGTHHFFLSEMESCMPRDSMKRRWP